jgi:hypothetical protein
MDYWQMSGNSSYQLEDGRITLYLREETKDPIWQARFKVADHRGYIRKSTGETDYDKAKARSYEMLITYEQRALHNLPVKRKSFKDIAILYYQKMELEHKEGRRSEGNLRVKRNTIFRYLIPYFGKRDINILKKRDIDQYKLWRRNYWKNHPEDDQACRGALVPTSATLALEWSVFRNVIELGIDLDHISPLVMRILKHDEFLRNRRPGFTHNEFEYLKSLMDEWANSAPNSFMVREREKTCDYICILAYSGIRKGEARQLKWRDIGRHENEHGSWVTFYVSGKTGSRLVACQPGIEKYLDRIKKRSLHLKKDDFVFCHDDGSSIEHLPSVRSLLIYANLLYHRSGKPRTIYSFRHYYATLRLENGASLFWLTRNMGTSVQMLERHYGHTHVLVGIEHHTATRKNSQYD